MFRDIDLRWLWILAVMLLVLLVAKCEVEAAGTFYGLGVSAGEQWQKGLAHVSQTSNWQELQIRPSYGKHMTDRWDLWVEGELGYIKWNDGHSGVTLGALAMTDYGIVKYKGYRLFTEIGVGLGWTSYTPNKALLRNNVLGLIDVGIGIEYKNIRIGPRFEHKSAIFAHDQGINTYGIMIIRRW
jgi:hypothetical protein